MHSWLPFSCQLHMSPQVGSYSPESTISPTQKANGGFSRPSSEHPSTGCVADAECWLRATRLQL